MKRILFLVAVLAAILPMTAVVADTSDAAIFIYRNDGEFDAFHRAKVDSITYSKIDLEGYEFDHFVVQEIWSGGEVTRLPIGVIDNVGFEQPEVIVSHDVFPLKAMHDPYIIAADTLSFTMVPTIPTNIRPHRGNIVVAEAECRSFENGILARVKDITYDAEGNYVYTCEAASLDDIYDQIVVYAVGTVEDDDENTSGPAEVRRRIDKTFNQDIWDKTFEGTIEKLAGTKYYANDKASCEIKVCKTLGQPLYANITLNNTFTGNVSLNYSTTKDYEPDPVQIGPTLKVGRISFPHPLLANLIWLEPQIRFSGYLKAHGELDVNFAAHLNRTDEVSLTYSNREWSIKHNPKMDAAVDTAMLSMKGFVEVGLIPDIMLALNGSATGAGITGNVGVKQTLDFKVDALELYDTSVYEAIKDTRTDTYLTYSTSIYVQSGLFDKDAPRKEYKLLDREKRLFSKYLFPSFGTSSYQRLSNDTHLVKIDAERDVIAPLKLGLRIYDADDNLVQVSPDTLAFNNKRAATYAFTLKDLDMANTYKAYPMVHLGKLTLRCTPAYTINKCPVQVDSIHMEYPYYDRSDSYAPNTMVYSIHASVTDSLPEDATEWGIAIGTTLYPFESIETEGTKYFSTGVPDGQTYGAGFRIDYYNYVFEVDRQARAYVKRINADGRETIMYSDLFNATLRYDTPPAMTYTDEKLESTTLISNFTDSNGRFTQQFKSVASYTMTLTGAFWLNYIDGAVDGNFSLSNNPIWQPTYDGVWRTSWDTTYLSTDEISHSNWHKIHLRYTGRVVESDRLNWVSSGTYVSKVTVTPSLSPARISQQKSTPKQIAPERTREITAEEALNPTGCISLIELSTPNIPTNIIRD